LRKSITILYSLIIQLITGKIGDYSSKLEKHMKIKFTILLVFFVWIGTACGGANEVATEITTDTPSPTLTEIPSTKTPEPVEETPAEGAMAALVSECTLVSSLSEPPLEYAEISEITEGDWAVGPEDATVTLIEYGDFQ
jgi:hypothetical protein